MSEETPSTATDALVNLLAGIVSTINLLALELRNARIIPADHAIFAQLDDLTQRLEATSAETLAAVQAEIDAARTAALERAKELVPATCPSCGRVFRDPPEPNPAAPSADAGGFKPSEWSEPQS